MTALFRNIPRKSIPATPKLTYTSGPTEASPVGNSTTKTGKIGSPENQKATGEPLIKGADGVYGTSETVVR